MAYSSEEVKLIWIAILICGSISVICCLFIILCYFFMKTLRGYEFRLILYITLSDMITSMMYMIPPNSNDHICSLQGTIVSFAEYFRIASSLLMSIYLHSTLNAHEEKVKEYEKFCLFVIFIISSIFTALPLITNSYGNAGGVCWIRVNKNNYLSGTLLRFGVFYIPLWIGICYTYWVYYLLVKNIKDLRRSSIVDRKYSESAIRKLWKYPMIMTISWLPDSIYRIIQVFDPEFKNVFLFCLSVGLIQSLGFFNALIYGFTSEVKDVLLRKCLRKDITSYFNENGIETFDLTQFN
jgi:hypothetical protein